MDLLAKNGSVTIHRTNLKVLATEMFKVCKNMLTKLMQGRFRVRRTHYNMRNPHQYVIPSINSVYHGPNSIPNLGPRIWKLVPY